MIKDLFNIDVDMTGDYFCFFLFLSVFFLHFFCVSFILGLDYDSGNIMFHNCQCTGLCV